MSELVSRTGEVWPSLPLDEWKDTYHILHMWTQIVGKIRLGSIAADQSMVAGHTICNLSRTHHLSHAVWGNNL